MVDLSNIKELSIAERILYVEDIWDSIAADQHSLEVTREQREELDKRVIAHNKTPEVVSTWDDVKLRLKSEE